ncbi:hypothetical protein MTsPCn5_29280 [Croceitalea sp. MTPC5]|uniref:Brp/Blh family beta-carotene 15,15'-dioxygenase n=1 Tax=Croceitalea sp. MTPC5 TaxID=3056565 RepID=UPI002B3B99A2|nr:hypothetical protein MTsPCn5_29280 [Croceitalea sp. MTPC5]
MKNGIIVATFFCLWISTMFSAVVQQFLGYALILTVGVLHGANDLTLIRFAALKNAIPLRYSSALLYYIAAVFGTLLLFFSYPPLALLSFILISGYHFGEQHFKDRQTLSRFFKVVLFSSYGLLILFMIFYFNVNKTIQILHEITGFRLTDTSLKFVLILSLVVFTAVMFYARLTKQLKANLIEEFFYLLVLFVVFNVADLLWGFAIYFILWHSIPSLADQIRLLYGKAGRSQLVAYLKSSWMYWLLSILGLVVIYMIFQDNMDFFISIMVYFLAAITFPHVIVMSKLEEG